MNYNLLDEKWIPVLWNDGRCTPVGVHKALENAQQISRLGLSSPLDLFAVHRFMLTLLYWKASAGGGVDAVRASLLECGRVPQTVLDAISAERDCFNLFDEKIPFLQDPSARNTEDRDRKSAGSLFAELATGTNLAHFNHGDDGRMRLCLPCTVLGLLRVIPWTQSGGAGLSPSVHNAPPIMALAFGDSLATTLGLNLIHLGTNAGQARWSGHFKPSDPTKPIPYLEALTWNPRRIYIFPPEDGTCWNCGSNQTPTVGKIVYRKNEQTRGNQSNGKKVPFIWKDPAAFYAADKLEAVKSTREDQTTTNSDLARLSVVSPTLAAVSDKQAEWCLIVPTTNPANNKTFDHRQVTITGLSSEQIAAVVLPKPSSGRSEGFDGWTPSRRGSQAGSKIFVRTAARLLREADWTVLANAAYRDMHDSPEAFDVLAGLYWGLRDCGIGGLPSRNVAWLVLKVMAAVPARMRVSLQRARYSPLDAMPKRQLNGRESHYPVSFPAGDMLESSLRSALEKNMRRRPPAPVDWAALCYDLNQLLD